MTARLPTLLACAAALAGCGGEKPPDEVIKEFYEASDKGDEAACGDLVTDAYLRRRSGGETGDAARIACEAQLEALASTDIRVRAIPFVRERGDRVDAVVELEADGKGTRQKLILRRVDGELRVDRVF